MTQHLALHKCRGELTYDMVTKLELLDLARESWINNDGHAVYPFAVWALDSLPSREEMIICETQAHEVLANLQDQYSINDKKPISEPRTPKPQPTLESLFQ